MSKIILSEKATSEILNKAKILLADGIKIKGNYSRQNDIIRVWADNAQVKFAVIATSGRDFGHSTDILEIKSFGLEKDCSLSLIIINDDIYEIRVESAMGSEKNKIELFYKSFIQSSVNILLTKKNIQAEGHNAKDLIYPLDI